MMAREPYKSRGLWECGILHDVKHHPIPVVPTMMLSSNWVRVTSHHSMKCAKWETHLPFLANTPGHHIHSKVHVCVGV